MLSSSQGKNQRIESNMTKSAIDAKRLNAFAMDPDDVIIIGLDTKDGPEHPLYDERVKLPVDQPLVLNIKHFGVIEPVVLRKNGDTAEVVDGRQRVRAAREANKQLRKIGSEPLLVPAMLRRGPEEALAGVMISANELRRDDDFKVKLKKLERYMMMHKTEEEAAISFGVSVQTIRNWLAVLDAAPEVRKAVFDGMLAPTAAAKLSTLAREEQVKALNDLSAELEAEQSSGRLPQGRRPQRVTGAAIERLKKARTRGVKKDDVAVAPSKKVLRKLLRPEYEFDHLQGTDEFIEGFKQALLWATGAVKGDDIPGLELEIAAALGEEHSSEEDE